jgi:hypothetical protein
MVQLFMRVNRVPVIDQETDRIRRYRTVHRRTCRMGQQRLVGGCVLSNQGLNLTEVTVRADCAARLQEVASKFSTKLADRG